MKTILLLPALALALALNAAAQEQPPAQILPGLAPPAIAIPVPEPQDPREDFPMPVDPEEGFDPGEMLMPDMPGRFQIISAQIQQNGKAVPIVLKLDTQTGQVWQLKPVTGTVHHNGKARPFTRLIFEPMDPCDHPQPLPHHTEPDRQGGGIEGGESIPEEVPRVEPAPERLSIDG